MAEKKNIPEIRFKRCSEEWKILKLNEVSDIIGGGTPSTMVPEYWNGDIDWYSPTEIGDRIYAIGSQKKITKLGLEKSSARILPANRTVLFTSRAGIGDMAVLKKDGATNQGFQSLVIKGDNNPYFFFSIGHLIKKYALKNASGSTFLEISGKQLGSMDISLPIVEEQSRIGTYFQHLDQLITLHQKKYNKLTNIKKAMLEKMFPKKGADVPEIRFKGFEGKWQVKRFYEMCWFQEGPGLRHWQFTNNGIKVINVTNLENGFLNLERTNRYISLEEFSKMYKHFEIDENDIVIASSGNSYGKVSIVRKRDLPLLMNTSVIRFKPFSSLTFDYLLTFLKSFHFKNQIDLLITGGAQPNFGPIHLNKTQISIPPKTEEQQKIGSYFQNLDKLITLQQTQIDKLKNIKKACLEKMFV